MFVCIAVRLPLQVHDVATSAEQGECDTETVEAGADADVSVAGVSFGVVADPPCEVDEDGFEEVRRPASRGSRRHKRT